MKRKWIGMAVGTVYASMAVTGAARADDHPDDCAIATPNPAPVLRCLGVLETATDVDWFRVSVQPGHLYSLHDYWWDCGFCAHVRVVADDCATNLVDIHGPTASDVYWFIAPAAGQVLVAVDQPAGGVGAGSAYEVLIQHVEGPVTDDFPDAIESAAPISTDGAWINGQINHSLDRDAFQFYGLAGHVYLIDTNPEDPSAAVLVNTEITDGLVGGVHDTIDVNNPYWGRPEGIGGTRIRVPESGGRNISVLVRWVSLNLTGPRLYRLRVVDDGPLSALTPTSDDCESPAILPMGEEFTILAPNSGSAVYLAMPVMEGHVYDIAFLATVGPHALDCFVGESCQSFNSIAGYRAGGQFQAAMTGTLKFGVSQGYISVPYDQQPPSAWTTLRVTDLGRIPDDSPMGAPPLPVAADGQWHTFHTDFLDDEDRFVIAVEPGRQIDLEFMAAGWGGGVQATFEGYIGTGFGASDASEVHRISCYVPVDYAGTLDVVVTGNSTVGGYRLRASELPAEGLRGNGCESPIAAPTDGRAQRVVFDDADGEDWIRFPGLASHIYRVAISDVTVGGYVDRSWTTSCGEPLVPLPSWYHTPAEIRPAADGPLLFRMTGHGMADVSITDLGIPDDREPDSPDGPVPPRLILPNRAAVAGRFDYQADVDYFRIRLRPGRLYMLGAGTPPNVGVPVASVCTADGSCFVTGRALHGATLRAPGDLGSPPIDYNLRLVPGYSSLPGDYVLRLSSWSCPSDWDDDGDRTQADLFEFLGAFLAGDLEADLDGSGAIGVQDLFEFITDWFGLCF